jgi:transposase
MYVEVVPNRNSRPAVLLREGWREQGKIRKRTLANLSHWAEERIETLRGVLKGDLSLASSPASVTQPFDIVRTRPHGHVVAALGTLRRVGLDAVIAPRRSPERDRVLGMIVARILEPRSKLATARGLQPQTLSSTLGEMLGLGSCTEDELYEAMDWLLARQEKIEAALAKRHLGERTLALYDLTSSYFEGRSCPLARFGHSRDGKRDKLQIVFGVLTNAEGCPVAVEVFEGNTADPKTLGSAVGKLRKRFGLQRIVLVGDRGMITSARIRDDLEKGASGIDWITALRAPQIQALLDTGSLQLSLFDQRDLAEITAPAYRGERLIACRNPLLAEERARKRAELLEATERELGKIQLATCRTRRPLHGKAEIALRVGRVLGRFKMKKHFRLQITDSSFSFERDPQRIEREAALDGIYIVRTNVPADVLSGEQVVESYKGLSAVERAFRCLKTVDLKVRPIHHRLEDRVRSHVLLCMLAYYVEWHMRRALAPMLFDDDDRDGARAERRSVVAAAKRSARAQRKALTKHTDDGAPVHSFQTMLQDLATVAKNRIQPKAASVAAFDVITRPTALQQRALDLLGVSLRP